MTKTIGDRIKERRLELNLTQEKVGELLGVSKVTIHKYESNSINIPSDRIEYLAKILNTTPAYLMGWEESPQDTSDLDEELLVLARNAKTLTKDQLQAIKRTIDAFKKSNEE